MTEDKAAAAAAPAVGDASFDAYYYGHCCGKPYLRNDEWLAFFGGIADRLIQDFQPKRVLDAGCALGLLVEGFRTRGVEAFGVDLSSFAIDRVHESVKPYCWRGSITEELPDRYDLIVSIEVLEHMPTAEAERAIANFCRHADAVVFSSSPFDYREPTHVNVHPPEYWADQFARHLFYRDVDFDASFITAWAACFRRGTAPLHRVVRDYERRYWALQLERNDARSYSMQVQGELAQALAALDAGKPAREALAAEQQQRQAEHAALDAERSAHARTIVELDNVRKEMEGARNAADTAEADRHDLRQALAAALADAAGLRGALDDIEQHVSNTSSALTVTQTALAQAQDRIYWMERSVFWRLRMAVAQVRSYFRAD